MSAGGLAIGTTISAAGLEVVSAGGSTMSSTIAGGTLELQAGSKTSGSILFVGSGGILQIDGTTMPAAPVSGFKLGDAIDLRAVAWSGGNTISFAAATVSGSITETLTLSGVPSGTNFALSDDGHGGTLVKETLLPRITDYVYGTFGGAQIAHIDPDGTLSDSGTFLSNGGQYAYGVAVGDVNADGRQDIAITGDNGYGRLYYNNGGGSFTDSGYLFPAQFQSIVVLGDINNDGNLDLFFRNGTSGSVLYRNDGASAFTPVFTINKVGSSGFQDAGIPRFGDMNGDGFQDIVSSAGGSVGGAETIFFNDGTGNFVNTQTVGSVGDDQDLRLADLNNDGSLDIVRAGSAFGVEVLLNNGSGHFSIAQTGFGPANVNSIQTGDLDGDGFADLVFGCDAGLEWWKNDGTGHFTFADILDPTPGAEVRKVGDFGNGRADIVYDTRSGGDWIRTLINDGHGHFSIGGALQPTERAGNFAGSDAGVLS